MCRYNIYLCNRFRDIVQIFTTTMSKPKKSRETLVMTDTSETIDAVTGEIVSSEKTTKHVTYEREKEPDYIKLYTDDIGRLFELPSSASDVLSAIASHMAYNTNIIVLYGPIKKIIMSELNMNSNTFNKAVDNLYRAGMLIRISRACYMVDPELYGKGSWQDVRRVRLSIEYNPDGTKSVKTELVKQMEDQKQLAIEEFNKRVQAKKQLTASNQLSIFDTNTPNQ